MKIFVIGMGPGKEDGMTIEAARILDECDTIIGYTVYLELLSGRYKDKELLSTPMTKEEERCRLCFEKASECKSVALVCSGDAGIYGMASLMYEIGKEYPDHDIEIIPGVSALSSGAAILGAPLNNDFCVISLSNYLTPYEKTVKRLKAAAEGDFAIVMYNPSSHKRKDSLKNACEVLLEVISPDTCCGYVKNIGREGCTAKVLTLAELKSAEVDMFTTVFVGNSSTIFSGGKLLTPRGYNAERTQ